MYGDDDFSDLSDEYGYGDPLGYKYAFRDSGETFMSEVSLFKSSPHKVTKASLFCPRL